MIEKRTSDLRDKRIYADFSKLLTIGLQTDEVTTSSLSQETDERLTPIQFLT